MRMSLHRSIFFAPVFRITAALFGFALLGAASAHGQARASASRKADAVVYAGYSFVQPDWGLRGTNDNGFIIGGTYSRYYTIFNREWGIGLDPRYSHVSGKTVNENAFTGNLQFKTRVWKKLDAYATVGYGFGTINFNYLPDPRLPNYTFDNGPVLAGGVGLTYEVHRNIAVKVDYQFQDWNLGQNETINPSVYSFGVQYRLPFGAWTKHGYERD